MTARVRITGARQTANALRALGRQSTQDKVLRQSLRPGARLMANAARQQAPVETGALRKSIAVGIKRMARGMAHLVVGHRLDDPQQRWRISHIIEYGSRFVGALPYMRPAFRQQAQAAVQAFGAAIWPLVSKEAVRVASRQGRRRR